MSATLEHLRRLRGQAGHAASLVRAPTPAPPPAPGFGATLEPVPESQRPATQTIDELRRLLRVRAPTSMPQSASRRDRTLPGDEIAPGLRLIESLLPCEPPPLRLETRFAKRENSIASQDVLCFDTETTGLAGGTGTRAFMIGVARWIEGGLRVRQWCMTTLAAERALLAAFAAELRDETVLVSYNGRCYDAPLLATRLCLSKLPNPIPDCDHLDLLHPVRRRYRGRWENCRLATIERRVLGIVREDDLPGSEAPAAWLGYLRGGSACDLRRVFEHNRQDLASLATLLLHLESAAAAECGLSEESALSPTARASDSPPRA